MYLTLRLRPFCGRAMRSRMDYKSDAMIRDNDPRQ